jgi:pimeloyl-ACP methyl ester carboxylesterase
MAWPSPAGGAHSLPWERLGADFRLGEITVPTLVMAGGYDFVFPPECQRELAAGIPNARLQIIDRAGHSPHSEQTAKVMAAVRHFLASGAPTA